MKLAKMTLPLIVLLTSTFSLLHEPAAATIAKPGCPQKCGNLSIPYPFGIGKDCYLNENFEVSCNATRKVARLSWFNYKIFKIENDSVGVMSITILFNYNKSSGQSLYEGPPGYDYVGDYYSYSPSKNKFMAFGCDIFAYVTDDKTQEFVTGCPSLCNDSNSSPLASLGTCSGNRCCQAPLPRHLSDNSYWVHTMNTKARSWASGQCSFSAIVDKDFSGYKKFNLSRCDHEYKVPIVLDWAIGNMSCREAVERKNYTCGLNSRCVDSARGFGYLCTCLPGYRGNPYLLNGCQDMDECSSSRSNKCPKGTICVNTSGRHTCSCPSGYHNDSSSPSQLVCLPDKGRKSMVLYISLGVGLTSGLLILVAFCVRLYKKLKKREKTKKKKMFFKRNGGLLLEQKMASAKGNVLETKIFAAEELEKATDNFNESRVLGKGGLGTVYKGMLSDGSIVAVKKSNKIDEHQVSQFINEVSILSQISHRHIVKLLGCCLDYEVPLLVYEYVRNGNLSTHLHGPSAAPTISWENRLRIAAEVAGGIAYLHSYASTAIYHRDIKSSNILLDENYRAVVSDFGLSRSVPVDKSHLTTVVGGTFGYLDPEYFRSGQLNDKSDVYAFGVVLAELLTSQKAVSTGCSGEAVVIQFRSFIKEDRLFELVDESIVTNEGDEKEEIAAVADLALRCLKLSARKRPCMKEVSAELEQLRRLKEFGSTSIAKLQNNYESNYSFRSETSTTFFIEMTIEDESHDLLDV